MKYFFNPFTSLSDVGTLKAFKNPFSRFYIFEGIPCFLYRSFLYEIDDKNSDKFLDIDSSANIDLLEKDDVEEVFIIPSRESHLTFQWDLVLTDLCETEEGWVYVLECQNRYKIGITSDIQSRMGQYNTHSPFKVKLYERNFVNGYKEIEAKIHKYFGNKRVHGEWFNLDKKDLRLLLPILR